MAQKIEKAMNRLTQRLSVLLNPEDARPADCKKILVNTASSYGYPSALNDEGSLTAPEIKTLALGPTALERYLRLGSKDDKVRSLPPMLYKRPSTDEQVIAIELIPGGRWLLTINKDTETEMHSLLIWDLLKIDMDIRPTHQKGLDSGSIHHKVAVQVDGNDAISIYVAGQVPGRPNYASLTVWSFHPSKTPADGHHLEQTFSEALPAVWVHNIQAYGRFILLHCDDQFKVLIWDRETNGWIFVHLASLWRLKLGDLGRQRWSCIVGVDEKTLTIWAGAVNHRIVHFILPEWTHELALLDPEPVILEHTIERRKLEGPKRMHWIKRAFDHLESLTPTLLLPQDIVTPSALTTYDPKFIPEFRVEDSLEAKYGFLCAGSTPHGDTLVLQVDTHPEGLNKPWQLSLLHATETVPGSVPPFTSKIVLQGGEEEQWAWRDDHFRISSEGGFVLLVRKSGEINMWKPVDGKEESRAL